MTALAQLDYMTALQQACVVRSVLQRLACPSSQDYSWPQDQTMFLSTNNGSSLLTQLKLPSVGS